MLLCCLLSVILKIGILILLCCWMQVLQGMKQKIYRIGISTAQHQRHIRLLARLARIQGAFGFHS